METTAFIPLDIFCLHHQVTVSFITEMEEAGWIEINLVDEVKVIPVYELAKAEQLARLTNELQVNPEGVNAIMQLLERMKAMQEEMNQLRNKISLYEERI